MDPISIIVTALVTGAMAALKPTTEQVIKDAYAGIKELIQRKYGRVDVAVLETDPASKARQVAIKEDLEKTDAGQDEELLRAAKALLDAIQAYASDVPKAVGLDLQDIKGASLTAERILAEGPHATGVKAKEADIQGDIRLIIDEWPEKWDKAAAAAIAEAAKTLRDIRVAGVEQDIHIEKIQKERVVSTGFAYETQADIPVDGAMPFGDGSSVLILRADCSLFTSKPAHSSP